MGYRNDIPPSKKSPKSKRTFKQSQQADRRSINQGGNSIRIIQENRNRRACCCKPETQKGIGAVIFTLGIPSIIAGVIITIVAVTDDDNDNKYPKSFIAIGPILLVLAVILFSAGIILHSKVARKSLHDCFSLNKHGSFCRRRCPALSQCLSRDDSIVISQAGMRALQAQPSKSVLKRNRLLSDPGFYGPTSEKTEDMIMAPKTDEVFCDEHGVLPNNANPMERNPRGVRFSDGDADDVPRSKRSRSITSTSENGSVLSLKHCKIHPQGDDIWWTDEQKNVNKTANGCSREEDIFRTTEL